MWDYLKKRVSEPSTYAGLAAAVLGIGQAFKIDEGQAVAEAVAGAGQAVAGGASPAVAGAVGLFGLLSVFMGEKGKR